jgi:hypothetical protein
MRKLITAILFILSFNVFGQADTTYSKFLILKSQSIDYYPVWGKTDNEIYINLLSKEWRKYDLIKSKYIEGNYLEHKLAINTAENWTIVTNIDKTNFLENDMRWKPRELKDKLGRVFSIEEEEFNTALYIKTTNGKKVKIMDIRGNAHSLAISPSGKYLACIFELSGLMIFNLEVELKSIK